LRIVDSMLAVPPDVGEQAVIQPRQAIVRRFLVVFALAAAQNRTEAGIPT
jgi:hypothetical protein